MIHFISRVFFSSFQQRDASLIFSRYILYNFQCRVAMDEGQGWKRKENGWDTGKVGGASEVKDI